MKKTLTIVLIAVLSVSLAVSVLISVLRPSGIKSGDVDRHINELLKLENAKIQSDEYIKLYFGSSEMSEFISSYRDVDFKKPNCIYEMDCEDMPQIEEIEALPESLRLSLGNMDIMNTIIVRVNEKTSMQAVAASSLLQSHITFACNTQKDPERYLYVYDGLCLYIFVSQSNNDVVSVSASPVFPNDTDEDFIEDLMDQLGVNLKKVKS